MSFEDYPQLSNQHTAPKNFNSSSLNNSTSNQNHPPFKLPDPSSFKNYIPNPNETLGNLYNNEDETPANVVNNQIMKTSGNFSLKEIAKHIQFEENGKITHKERFIYCGEPIQAISNIKNALVLQATSLLEMVSGHVTDNEYNVFFDSPEGLIYAFHFKEKSNYCCRNCCLQKKRTYEMTGRHIPSANELDKLMNFPYLEIQRPCGCPCCCCNCCRPYLIVKLASTGQYLGKIQDANACCEKLIEVHNASGNLLYEVKTTEFQIGFCSGRDTEEVAEIKFNITRNGNIVGYIIKMSQLTTVPVGEKARVQYGMNDKSNSFLINFPEESSPAEKLLLIMAAIMIGYQFFKGNVGKICPSNPGTCCGCCLNCIETWFKCCCMFPCFCCEV